MRPRLRGIIRFTASWMQKKVPFVLMAMTRSHSASVISKRGAELITPAQVTRISTGPNASSVNAKSASISSRRVTSVRLPRTSAPSSATVRSNPAVSTSPSTTRAPSRTSPRATARPRPLAPPVTTATLPSSPRNSLMRCLWHGEPPPSKWCGWSGMALGQARPACVACIALAGDR